MGNKIQPIIIIPNDQIDRCRQDLRDAGLTGQWIIVGQPGIVKFHAGQEEQINPTEVWSHKLNERNVFVHPNFRTGLGLKGCVSKEVPHYHEILYEVYIFHSKTTLLTVNLSDVSRINKYQLEGGGYVFLSPGKICSWIFDCEEERGWENIQFIPFERAVISAKMTCENCPKQCQCEMRNKFLPIKAARP